MILLPVYIVDVWGRIERKTGWTNNHKYIFEVASVNFPDIYTTRKKTKIFEAPNVMCM